MRLSNQLHENFARLIAEGLTPTDAYRQLKPNSRQPSVLGSRLWNRQDIRIRISEIVEEAVQERNLTIQQKISLLEQQIRGKSPTKVKVSSNGKKEVTYDMLEAIKLHSRLCGDFDGVPSKPKGPLLDLQFNIVGRNEPMTPELEEDWKLLQGYDPTLLISD
jgi:hypothetical protein